MARRGRAPDESIWSSDRCVCVCETFGPASNTAKCPLSPLSALYFVSLISDDSVTDQDAIAQREQLSGRRRRAESKHVTRNMLQHTPSPPASKPPSNNGRHASPKQLQQRQHPSQGKAEQACTPSPTAGTRRRRSIDYLEADRAQREMRR